MRQVLTRARNKVHNKDEGAPTLGKRYYTKLADDFAHSDPAYQLALADKTQAACTECFSSLMGVIQHPQCFDAAMEHLELVARVEAEDHRLVVPPVREVARWTLTNQAWRRLGRSLQKNSAARASTRN